MICVFQTLALNRIIYLICYHKHALHVCTGVFSGHLMGLCKKPGGTYEHYAAVPLVSSSDPPVTPQHLEGLGTKLQCQTFPRCIKCCVLLLNIPACLSPFTPRISLDVLTCPTENSGQFQVSKSSWDIPGCPDLFHLEQWSIPRLQMSLHIL